MVKQTKDIFDGVFVKRYRCSSQDMAEAMLRILGRILAKEVCIIILIFI